VWTAPSGRRRSALVAALAAEPAPRETVYNLVVPDAEATETFTYLGVTSLGVNAPLLVR
jgi:hypothetical protein